MLTNIYDVLYSFATEYMKILLFLWGIMNIPFIKNKKALCFILLGQTIIIFVTSLFRDEYPDEMMFFRALLVMISVGLILQGKFFQKLAYSMLLYIFILFLDLCYVGLFSLIIDMTGAEVTDSSIVNYAIDIIDLTLISLIIFLRRRKKISNTQIHISKQIYSLLFAGIATGLITLASLLVRSNDATTEVARKAMVIVSIIVVICYIGVCLMIVIVAESRDNYKALSLINQNIIESQQQYYVLVNEKQQEMRGIRHEMKNHLSCIYALYQANRLEEMEQYLNQMVETSDNTGILFDTGNDIVNAILNDAQSKHKKDNIAINLKGSFPEKLYISAMDLCVIFANLVSNAIEAIIRMDRESDIMSDIDIKISSYKDDLYIEVTNPMEGKLEYHNGRFLTLKRDKNLHGFGIKNIIQRVEKYQGTASFKSDNDRFFVDIYMKNRLQ